VRVHHKKEHTIQFTKVQYFCHYAKKLGGFYVIERSGGRKGEVREVREYREIREYRECREFNEFREFREVSLKLPLLFMLPNLLNFPNHPNSQPLISTETNFLSEGCRVQHSAKKNVDGLYLSVLPIHIFFC
jgi:hypothetical protein